MNDNGLLLLTSFNSNLLATKYLNEPSELFYPNMPPFLVKFFFGNKKAYPSFEE
jgi:hypothetical protein